MEYSLEFGVDNTQIIGYDCFENRGIIMFFLLCLFLLLLFCVGIKVFFDIALIVIFLVIVAPLSILASLFLLFLFL